MRSADTPFYQTPETLDSIRMNVARHVHAFTVVYPVMVVPIRHVADAVVRLQFVGKDGALRQHILFNVL